MQTLEVGDLRRIAGLNQRFKSFFEQRRQPATKHGLLTEKVALGFFFKGSLQNSRACRPDAVGIGQSQFMRVPAGILLNRDQRGYSAAFGKDAAHQVSWTLGSDHHYVNVRRRNDCLEMNAEAVR